MDKKLVKPISLILAAVLLFSLLMGSMAYFSDTAKTQTSGKAGTVAISVDSNINLLDAEGRDILNPGDKRDAGFTVTNEGNKSVDVRTTMALTVQSNVEGNTLTFTGDADNQSEYDLYLADDVELVEGEGYKPKKVADANGKNPGDEGYVDTFAKPLQVKSINNDVITYILPEYVLNGNSDKYTEYETVDGVTGYSRTFDYVFVMKGETGNAWQNSAVSIDVLVEAKQHENSAAGWNIVAQENVTVGSINQDAVMGENVITDSSRMMIVYTGGTSVVNPPLQAAEALYGEDLGTVNVVSNSRIYNQLVDSGNYTDVSRDTNMDVVAGVIEGTSTLSTAETIGSSVFYIAAKDNTIIMAPDDVTNLFANLRHIKKIILEKLYFNNTTNMNGMFQNSSSLQQVVFPDVSSGAVAGPGGTIIRPEYSNVTNVNNIFNGCTNIENVDLKEFTNITTANNAFTGCESLKNLDMSSLNYVDITWLKWLFENANELQKIVISAQAEQGIKKESSSDEQASISGVIESVGTLPPVEKVDGTYAQLLTGSEINTKLKNLNSTSPYTKIKFVRDTSIYNQIKTTPDYAELSAQGVSAFMGVIGDTCYVATPSDKIMYAPNDSSNMFAILTWVTDIDLEDLDTSDVTDMSYMFYYCSALTNVNVSSFNTSKVTNMSRMFHYCSSLTSLDLSNFNTSSVTDMFNIFYYCNKLTTIYVSGLWNVNNVTNSNGMFSNCEKIIGQSGKAYDKYNVDKTHANYETGYLTYKEAPAA
ncbi:MAG: TasA family protein [Acutalibacteraceae bacterium]|nr:TasA family protein [Acutalibacteraceae bacterium]